jgi:hypothetical protein
VSDRPSEPRVVVLPDTSGTRFEDDTDPGDVVFDEAGTPMLVYEHHPAFKGREGWVLFYLEADGSGVEDHPIGGDLAAVDWALEASRD